MDNGQHVFLRCCTAYRGFLGRIGASGRTFLQPRMAIPVIAPDGPPGGSGEAVCRRRFIWRAPWRDIRSSVRESVCGPPWRPWRWRGWIRFAELDRSTFGQWLDSRRQSPAAVESLWNLIALPTLNLPADAASLALAVKVFRTGLLTKRDAADVGYATAPRSPRYTRNPPDGLCRLRGHRSTHTPVRAVEATPGGMFVVHAGPSKPTP